MKKIIITRSQLNEVMDSQKTQVAFTGNNAVEMGNNAQEKYNDALRSGLKANTIQMDGKSTNNNATDNDEAVIGFDTSKGNIRDAVTDAVNNAVNNGVDINKLNVQGNSEDLFANESKYSKKQIEQARLHEIRKNGTILTKKQLTEEIITKRQLEELASTDNMSSLIQKMNDMNMFQVFEAYRQTFGDEALQELSNHWNTMQEIVNVVYSSDEQKQQEFMARLDGTYEGDDETFELDLNY